MGGHVEQGASGSGGGHFLPTQPIDAQAVVRYSVRPLNLPHTPFPLTVGHWPPAPSHPIPPTPTPAPQVDAGVAEELVFGDPEAPRFVYWEGRLRPTPSGLDALTFDLMSFLGKIRAGLGAIGLKAPAPEGVEESVEQFIRRNLGDEVFYRLIEPFCRCGVARAESAWVYGMWCGLCGGEEWGGVGWGGVGWGEWGGVGWSVAHVAEPGG